MCGKSVVIDEMDTQSKMDKLQSYKIIGDIIVICFLVFQAKKYKVLLLRIPSDYISILVKVYPGG